MNESGTNATGMTPTPDRSRAQIRVDKLEDDAVMLAKQMAAGFGSTDANDSGPAICAIWNLGSEARRLASILDQILAKARQA